MILARPTPAATPCSDLCGNQISDAQRDRRDGSLARFRPAIVVCAVGRQLPGSWLGGRLQASSSAAHAVGCAVVDNIHDGAIMIPSYFNTPCYILFTLSQQGYSSWT